MASHESLDSLKAAVAAAKKMSGHMKRWQEKASEENGGDGLDTGRKHPLAQKLIKEIQRALYTLINSSDIEVPSEEDIVGDSENHFKDRIGKLMMGVGYVRSKDGRIGFFIDSDLVHSLVQSVNALNALSSEFAGEIASISCFGPGGQQAEADEAGLLKEFSYRIYKDTCAQSELQYDKVRFPDPPKK